MSADADRPIRTVAEPPAGTASGARGARVRPTEQQRRWLLRGVGQPGGKLPLFDEDGREIGRKTVESCRARGWVEPWFDNPTKPDWLVCRLTAAGYRAVGAAAPDEASAHG